jgi:N-acetyl-beta-hexosaminidase
MRVYGFEPVPEGLTAEEAKHILGGQGCIWTEYIPSEARVDYMAVPRMIALAETLWSPKKQKDWKTFAELTQNKIVIQWVEIFVGWDLVLTAVAELVTIHVIRLRTFRWIVC